MGGDGKFGEEFAAESVAQGQAAGFIDRALKNEDELESVGSGQGDDKFRVEVKDCPAAAREIEQSQRAEGVG